MKRRDNPIPFRPTAEARLALAELLKSGKKRNAILNEAVIAFEDAKLAESTRRRQEVDDEYLVQKPAKRADSPAEAKARKEGRLPRGYDDLPRGRARESGVIIESNNPRTGAPVNVPKQYRPRRDAALSGKAPVGSLLKGKKG